MQGSEYLLDPKFPGDPKKAVLDMCKRHFRPEFLNRLDELVVFEPLNRTQLREVARMMSGELSQRLAARNVTMKMTDAALDFAVAESYDHLYGARPLRRWLVGTLGKKAVSYTSQEEMLCGLSHLVFAERV